MKLALVCADTETEGVDACIGAAESREADEGRAWGKRLPQPEVGLHRHPLDEAQENDDMAASAKFYKAAKY